MKLTLTTFLSMDGVMQGPGGADEDGTGGFDRGGWLVPYADADMGRFVEEWFAEADAFLLGRRTYEMFAGFWPQVTDPANLVATKLNTLPKHVVSTTLTDLPWAGSVLLRGELDAQVAELKRRPGRELQVHGSGTLARSLMAHDLIDEYRLWVFPVVVGAGRRLFPDNGVPAALELVETKTTAAGVVVHVYRSAGRPTFGQFGITEDGAETTVS